MIHEAQLQRYNFFTTDLVYCYSFQEQKLRELVVVFAIGTWTIICMDMSLQNFFKVDLCHPMGLKGIVIIIHWEMCI